MNLVSLFDESLISGHREKVAVRLCIPAQSVTAAATVEQQLTYCQVNENADVIAQCLRDVGACHVIVASVSEPHVNVPSIMLGVMRVPSVILFVDCSTPKCWNTLKDLNIKYLIAKDRGPDRFLGADLPSTSVTLIRQLHGATEGLCLYNFANVGSVERYDYLQANGWQLAYAVSTSGTTGAPKLVRVPHRCIVPNIVHFKNVYRVTSCDVILVASPMTFDPSVVDIFLALSTGASIVLVPDDVKRSPRALISVMTDVNRVTIIQATPSLMKRFGTDLLRNVIFSPLTTLRVLGLGGEPCPDLATLSSWIDRDQDIKPEIYNVYGITEVSAWASLQRIHFGNTNTIVPLGDAIPGTEMIVLDDDGQRVSVGEGHLFLGGSTRKCFVDSEDFRDVMCKPVFRPSGDHVRIDSNGRIFHLSRIDDRIKRNGKFVSLTLLEKAGLSFPDVVEARAVWNCTRERIILAVVLNDRPDRFNCQDDFIRKLKNHVNGLCDTLLDGVVLLDVLPITAHGKLDERKVAAFESKQFLRHDTVNNESECCAALKRAWNRSLGLDGSEVVDDGHHFLSRGGDSIRAVALCEDLRRSLNRNCPQLMDKVLNETYDQVRRYLLHQVADEEASSESLVVTSEAKSERIAIEVASGTRQDASVGRWITRGSSYRHGATTMAESSKERVPVPSRLSFAIRWRCNIGRCVDASPLIALLPFNDIDRWTVFIGSHSHAFAAVDLESGRERWRWMADDRIESSACASPCSTYVFVGSYDRHLYCLTARSGELRWKFETGGAIKSSPVAHPTAGRVYFGSHDHSVYAVDMHTGSLCWACKPGGGSVFCSPCLRVDGHHQLYVGTLDGIFCALCPDTGQKLWSFNCRLPIFSSPALTSFGVCVGCVDGKLYCFNDAGVNLWQYSCEGPVFSSPCHEQGDRVLVGCHDGRVHCVRSDNGQALWSSSRLDSEVYATPFVTGSIVYVCTVRGTLHALSVNDGSLLGEFALPKDVFSSPVVVRGKVVVGCRDDHLYCIGVT